jgi:hypothetical protein
LATINKRLIERVDLEDCAARQVNVAMDIPSTVGIRSSSCGLVWLFDKRRRAAAADATRWDSQPDVQLTLIIKT